MPHVMSQEATRCRSRTREGVSHVRSLPQAQKTGQKLLETCPKGGLSAKLPLQQGPDAAPPKTPSHPLQCPSQGIKGGVAHVAQGRMLSTGPPWEKSQDRGKTAGLGTREGTLGLAPQSSAVWLVEARSRPAPECGFAAGFEGWLCH